MKAADLGELAVRNLREAILRNSLTTLGIAVGIASLVAMLSLGVGLQELASKKLSGSGLFDTVLVMPRMKLRGFGRPSPRNSTPVPEARPLDESARGEMEKLPNVAEVFFRKSASLPKFAMRATRIRPLSRACLHRPPRSRPGRESCWRPPGDRQPSCTPRAAGLRRPAPLGRPHLHLGEPLRDLPGRGAVQRDTQRFPIPSLGERGEQGAGLPFPGQPGAYVGGTGPLTRHVSSRRWQRLASG